LARKAKECGHKAVGLTDHGTFAGAIQFVKACRAEDINPVLGMESYLCRDHKGHSKAEQPDGRRGNRHLNLFAKNLEGYRNLCSLSQIASLEGFYYDPRIDVELLAKYSSGVICSSACLKNIINWNLVHDRYNQAKKAASIFKDIFADDFYLEVMYHGIEEEAKIIPQIQKISKELDIKMILSNDCHYVEKSDAKYHAIALCLRDNKNSCIKDPKRMRYSTKEFYFKTTEQMSKIFPSLPKSMRNTLELAEKCDLSELQFGGMNLPHFEIPEKYKMPFDFLSDLAWTALKQKGLDTKNDYVERLKLELNDIKLIYDTKGYHFDTYFLIIWDIVKFIREKNIPYGVRGSGNGSLLLYCLNVSRNITDPVKYKLFWSRFLGFENSATGERIYARPGWPDVDIDICFERRCEVENYVIEKYGRENVANIGNVGKLKIKSAIRKTIKVLDPCNVYNEDNAWGQKYEGPDPNFQLENNISETLPDIMKKEDGSIVGSVEEAYELYSDFRDYMDKYPVIYEAARAVQGVVASYGCLSGDTPILTGYGWVRIDQLDKSFNLAFVNNNNEINFTNRFRVIDSGVKKCYKMKLKNGSTIKVTDEHKIFTNKGCVEFKKIRKNPKKYRILCLKR